MRHAKVISRLITLGLIIILLAMAGFSIWIAMTTLQVSNDVEEAVTISTLSDQVGGALDKELDIQSDYWHNPGSVVRTEHQVAATEVVKALQAALSQKNRGSYPFQRVFAIVLAEHQRYVSIVELQLAAIDAGDMRRAGSLENTSIDPLSDQMQQQIDGVSAFYHQDATHLLALLDQMVHRNVVAIPVVFALGLVMISILWTVLRLYQRRVDEAKRAEMSQLEEIARVKTVQLEQQRRLTQLKDQFIANVSHELRTPLTAVYGYVELLHEHWESLDAAVQTRFVRQIKRGCEDLLMLTDSILETTKVERDLGELSPEPTPVGQVVQEVLTGWDPRDLHVHTLEVDLPEHVVVWADRQALRQVLCNLLSNACKYAPKQSAISIRAEFDEQIEDTNAPGQVCIRVQDAGPGIPPDEGPLLFQKFVRLKRDLSGTVRGTGLGLYISRQPIEAMNGQIWVESSGKPGEGSCFCFTLPRTALHPRDECVLLGAS